MVRLNAHFDGKTIVPDELQSLPFRSGTKLRVTVEIVDEEPRAAAPPRRFQPLNIDIDAELSNFIALDPRFSIEES